MAKTRAVRRAARESERAARILNAQERHLRNQRRSQRLRKMREQLRIPFKPGLLAQKRRRRVRLLVFIALTLNLLVWVLADSVAASALVGVVTLLVAPMFSILSMRRLR